MQYHSVHAAIFLRRPNRFLASILLGEKEEVCHVKNTGRCKELLVPGASVLLAESQNPARKTKYDLIAVYKGDRLINIDSSAPNQVMGEYLPKAFPGAKAIRAEVPCGASRLDFQILMPEKRIWVEVKGVTLEENGIVRFPDAPTQRGIKHLGELMHCVQQGDEARVAFIVQMENARWFEPNDAMHAAFGAALRNAAQAGVKIDAYACHVQEDRLSIAGKVPVRL